MGLMRRLLSVGLGVAAGAFADKLLKDYNDDGHIDAEYVELPLQEDATPQVNIPHRPDTGPNVNPVGLGHTEKPVDEQGRLDPTKIASPEDFADWDELGCQS